LDFGNEINLELEFAGVRRDEHVTVSFSRDFQIVRQFRGQDCQISFKKLQGRAAFAGDLGIHFQRKAGFVLREPAIIAEIQRLRHAGFGKYDIYDTLIPVYGSITPSITTIYNILKRYGINKPSEYLEKQKRRYVKEKMGELGHIDCHYLEKGTIEDISSKRYLLCLTDDHTRLSWSIVLASIQATVVSHGLLKLLSVFKHTYGITFTSILSDNGGEFKGNVNIHPTELLLHELGISHRYTRPYRPQTNGKVERFWRSIEAELLRETIYPTQDALAEELVHYSIYYNHIRKHYGIARKTPYQALIHTQHTPTKPLSISHNLSPI